MLDLSRWTLSASRLFLIRLLERLPVLGDSDRHLGQGSLALELACLFQFLSSDVELYTKRRELVNSLSIHSELTGRAAIRTHLKEIVAILRHELVALPPLAFLGHALINSLLDRLFVFGKEPALNHCVLPDGPDLIVPVLILSHLLEIRVENSRNPLLGLRVTGDHRFPRRRKRLLGELLLLRLLGRLHLLLLNLRLRLVLLRLLATKVLNCLDAIEHHVANDGGVRRNLIHRNTYGLSQSIPERRELINLLLLNLLLLWRLLNDLPSLGIDRSVLNLRRGLRSLLDGLLNRLLLYWLLTLRLLESTYQIR